MEYRLLKNTVILTALFLFLLGGTGLSHASMTMDEVRQRFKEEKEKQWEDATSRERKDFLYYLQGRERIEEREARVEGVKTPFYIRDGFWKQTGIDWEEATEKEKKRFLRDYELSQKQWERDEKLRLREIELHEKRVKRERQLEEQKIARKKRAKELAKKRKQEALERKKKEEKRKVEASKKKRNELRAKIAELRDRDDNR